VGRVSAAINRRFNDHYKTRIGFFGFFEVIDDYDVAKSLLDHARAWVKGRGMTVLRGPGEYSNATHERQGILIEGFQYPPTVELTHNPPYYSKLLKRYGFQKAKDYYAYVTDLRNPDAPQLDELVEQIRQRRQIETRPLKFAELVSEIQLVIKIYNDSWSQNWGFLPVTDGEAHALAESLRPIIDPGLVRFAFIDGEPAAVLGSFPDPNYALRPRWRWYGDNDLIRLSRLLFMRRHIPRGRLMFFGIRPGFRNLGIDALLYYETREYAVKRGYRTCEASMLLEDNDLILRACETMGARHYKTWRIYDLPLE
jgi:GNAT superfamily N-acetyltransferase